jgi:hypothetical protein
MDDLMTFLNGPLAKGSLAFSAVLVGWYILSSFRAEPRKSSLPDMPGPPKLHWLYGSSPTIWDFDATGLQEEWIERYGTIFKLYSLLGVRGLQPY